MSLYNLVGHLLKPSVSKSKSAMAWWTTLVSVTLSPSTWLRAYCMCMKRPQAPGNPVSMEKISPSTQCHLSILMRFWMVVIRARISLERFSLCGGKDKVMLTMSITHPRRTCQADHVKPPDIILFSGKTSLRLAKSPESQSRNTLSRRWNKVSRTRCRR